MNPPPDWYCLPPELWNHIFSFLPIRDKVTCRLVSRNIKLLVQHNLARILAVYASDDKEKGYRTVAAPFVDETADKKYSRSEGNFLKLTPSPEDKLLLNERTLKFLQKYFTSLEALITLAEVPFVSLARTIGPRLHCFFVASGLCNETRYTKVHLKKMAKLQFYAGKNLPCPFEFIECSIQLVAASLLCHRETGKCSKHRRKVISSLLPSSIVFLSWRSQGPQGSLINPPFSESIRALRLTMVDSQLTFRFPNLCLLGIHAAENSRWNELFDSIQHSHYLTILCIKLPEHSGFLLEQLVLILNNFANLMTLIFVPKKAAANDKINLKDWMIDTIVRDLPKLKRLLTRKDLCDEGQLEKLQQKIPSLVIDHILIQWPLIIFTHYFVLIRCSVTSASANWKPKVKFKAY